MELRLHYLQCVNGLLGLFPGGGGLATSLLSLWLPYKERPYEILKLCLFVSFALLLFAACSETVEEPQTQMEQTFPEEAQSEQQSRMGEIESDYQEVQGEVLSVNADDQTLIVRTDAGEEVQVTYSSDTRVSGSHQGTQGLATVEGSRVLVIYEEGIMGNTAVEIEVEPMTTG